MTVVLMLAAALPVRPQAVADSATPPREITFRFHDAELAELVGFLAKLDERIPILDEKVKGKVSVAAPGKVSLDEAYGILMAVLDVRGYNLVRDGRFLKVTPKQEATYAPIDVFFGADAEALPAENRMITALVPVAKAKGAQVLDTLRPLISPVGNAQLNAATNILVITDVAVNLRRLLRIVPFLDKPEKAEDKTAPAAVTEVYPIKYLTAKEMAETLGKVFTAGTDAEGKAKATFKFTAVDSVNALLVSAEPDGLRQVKATLAQLDTRRRQVLIEARVVDLSLKEDFNTGVRLKEYKKQADGKTLTNTIIYGSALPNYLQYNLEKALYDGGNLSAALEIMQSNGLIKIIATPKILTADNQKAKIVIGTEEPILKSKTDLGTDGGGTGKTVSDYIYKDVGFELSVTPHINVDNDVSVELGLKTTSILDNVDFGDVNAPRMGKRELSATVNIKHGHTMVLGGLIDEDTTRNRQQVPILGSIPLIGWLFSKRTSSTNQREMLVFITATVADTIEAAAQLTGEQAESLNLMQSKVDKKLGKTEPRAP